jgi:hypothetical protein
MFYIIIYINHTVYTGNGSCGSIHRAAHLDKGGCQLIPLKTWSLTTVGNMLEEFHTLQIKELL